MEKHREKIRQLIGKKVPYQSPQMKTALEDFQKADDEWKRLEQEHLKYRELMGIENDNV